MVRGMEGIGRVFFGQKYWGGNWWPKTPIVFASSTRKMVIFELRAQPPQFGGKICPRQEKRHGKVTDVFFYEQSYRSEIAQN